MNYTTKYQSHCEAVCIGRTIVVFNMKQTKPYDTKIFTYDISKNQWSENECSVLKKLINISCVKYYID